MLKREKKVNKQRAINIVEENLRGNRVEEDCMEAWSYIKNMLSGSECKVCDDKGYINFADGTQEICGLCETEIPEPLPENPVAKKKCPDCKGTGKDNVPYGEKCDTCDGEG